ncbi:MAG: TlpA family protein disulfide reductase [Flavobacteriaceae bacterium]|nr:TlpA family protein disulfide reductase [Flavobacteriaceae bacterium]
MKTLKKSIFAILVVALAVSCNGRKDVNYALISGKITNAKGNILITQSRKKVKEITVKEDGTFKDTIFNPEGYYNLSHSRETTPIYLQNGDDLTLTLDTKQFDETVTYKGYGAKENNYLAQKFLIKEKELGDVRTLFKLDENAFLEKVNSVKTQLEKAMKGLEGDFAKSEQKKLKYENAVSLSNYERYHRILTNNKDFKVSEKFPNPTEGMDMENEEDFKKYDSYKQLVMGSFYNELAKEGDKEKALAEKLGKMKDGEIKKNLIGSLVMSINNASEKNQKLYDVVMKVSKDDKLKNDLKAKMNKFKKLVKGNPSPIFENYENYKGGKTSLKDFRGKYVYIDVWATWCGPCKGEIPHMKKVEEKYHGKKIAFVSISVDDLKNKEGWKKMVKEKEMAGVQLFADKSWKSTFVNEYGINGIPRFIFLDKKGNIIDANAPRPSDPRLIELFKQYGL